MERMSVALIVQMVVILMGVPVSASARSVFPAPSPSLMNAQAVIGSPNGAFVISTIEQARTQLALARLAISETNAIDTRNLASQSQELWTSVDIRLHDIAQALGIPTPAEQDAKGRAELYRLAHIKSNDFDFAYARLVARGCNAILDRMGRMDPEINSRLLFFVDDMLPRFGQLQMGVRKRELQVGL